jgi:hypothetical protein
MRLLQPQRPFEQRPLAHSVFDVQCLWSSSCCEEELGAGVLPPQLLSKRAMNRNERVSVMGGVSVASCGAK